MTILRENLAISKNYRSWVMQDYGNLLFKSYFCTIFWIARFFLSNIKQQKYFFQNLRRNFKWRQIITVYMNLTLCVVHVYVCLSLLDCLSKLLTDRKWRTDEPSIGWCWLAGHWALAGRSLLGPWVHLLEFLNIFPLTERIRTQDIVSIHRNSYFLPHESKNNFFS